MQIPADEHRHCVDVRPWRPSRRVALASTAPVDSDSRGKLQLRMHANAGGAGRGKVLCTRIGFVRLGSRRGPGSANPEPTALFTPGNQI
jgi:hypothetical protein